MNFIYTLVFKNTICGDLLASSNNAVKNALNKLEKSNKLTQEESIETLGVDMHIPDPVFFCSIEPPSQVNTLYSFILLSYFKFKYKCIFMPFCILL